MGNDETGHRSGSMSGVFIIFVGFSVLPGHAWQVEGIPNFPLNMGISGNVLDRTYNSLMDVPAIMSEWASQCVAAYNINETACSFAAKSMESNDPTSNVSQVSHRGGKQCQTS